MTTTHGFSLLANETLLMEGTPSKANDKSSNFWPLCRVVSSGSWLCIL